MTFVTHEYFPTRGGAATVVFELSKAGEAIGWRTKVLAPGKSRPSEDSTVPVIRMGHRGRQDLFARRALLKFLGNYHRAGDEHLVFSDPGSTRAALYAPDGLLRHPAGYSVILHGSEIPLFGSSSTRSRFRNLLEGARRIHLLSEANRHLLPDWEGLTGNTVRVAAGAPSSWTRAHATGIRNQADDDRMTILTVGRIHPRKGQKETLLALSRLPSSVRARIRYRMIGPTVRMGYRRQIERISRDCDFPVEFPGIVPDRELVEAYRSATLFALTSQPRHRSIEGFGLVYLDASACGLPIVANRLGGVPEAVLEGKTGLLADPGNPDELTRAFQCLLENPNLRTSFRTAGTSWANQHDWRKTLQGVWTPWPEPSL